MTKKTKQITIAVVAVALVLVLMGVCWALFGPKGTAGTKNITVMVLQDEVADKTFPIKTDSEFLRGALDSINLVQGDESEYGLFIKTVDGVTVDESLQQWWCVTKGGEDVMTGVEMTPIADGDVFELTLKTGW